MVILVQMTQIILWHAEGLGHAQSKSPLIVERRQVMYINTKTLTLHVHTDCLGIQFHK